MARRLDRALNLSSQTLTHSVSGRLIPYRVTHRPRVTRRLHLELDEQGQLVVVAPRGWPDYHVVQLLRKNLSYVERFLATARSRQPPALSYAAGGRHYYRGMQLSLDLHSGRGPATVQPSGNRLVVRSRDDSPQSIARALRQWYRQSAAQLFELRLAHWRSRAPWARDREVQLKLRRMRRTWGTCSRDGVIRLNTHLVKAPPECLDYVIVHELCHLRHMNHGPGFHALQASLYPEWSQRRSHLREFGSRYTQE